ncbi:hypothetical protein ALC62_14502 [Cyphomyrmex costatus]|uniref:Uncharacterized protein n=1 Tax=Cyphomyrmex costatus TaxID=456900 RepID=A0A195C237_9HYME|nr:hypothetical protein ALC62_14502 [Cyphomyrmex costatus]
MKVRDKRRPAEGEPGWTGQVKDFIAEARYRRTSRERPAILPAQSRKNEALIRQFRRTKAK